MADVVALPTLLHVALTLLAFALGLAVGWLWWGRQFLRARLTRDEALSIMQAQVERELAATDARIAGLVEPYEGLGFPDGPTAGGKVTDPAVRAAGQDG